MSFLNIFIWDSHRKRLNGGKGCEKNGNVIQSVYQDIERGEEKDEDHGIGRK